MLVYNSLLHKMGHRYVHLELLGENPSLYSFATFILALFKRHEFPTFHCVDKYYNFQVQLPNFSYFIG